MVQAGGVRLGQSTMIQDDPINQKSSNGMDYLLLNNESEEEIIPFQSIEPQVGDKISSSIDNNSSNSIDIYYKFALLIGLCKHKSVVYNMLLILTRYNARDSTWSCFWINSLHVKE